MNTTRIFVFGRIEYFDAFGEQRFSNFRERVYFPLHPFKEEGRMVEAFTTPEVEGNDAD